LVENRPRGVFCFDLSGKLQWKRAIDASPAIAGKQLFLRGRKYLYCVEAP
jgi:hypothetical protein